MWETVTDREELAELTLEETIEGYTPANANVAQSLAARADATDCIYFEGALTDRPGGVVRAEPFDINAFVSDLHHVLPGYFVAAVEPVSFWAEGAIEEAIEEGKITNGEWDAMSEQDQEEFIGELRRGFRQQYGIQQSVDLAMRAELVADKE